MFIFDFQMTPGAFQLSDIYPPITITPKRLSFSSPSTLAPENSDDNDVVRRPLGLDVAFLVGKTTPEIIQPTKGNVSTTTITEGKIALYEKH